jgi:translocation and assembly module TamA
MFMRSLLFFLIVALLLGQPLCLPAQVFSPEQIVLRGDKASAAGKRLQQDLRQAQNEKEVQAALDRWRQKMASQGYREARIDSMKQQDQSLQLRLVQGPHYSLQPLAISGMADNYQKQCGLDKYQRKNLSLNYPALEADLQACLSLFQNEGFPFASFQLEKQAYQRLSPDSISLSLSYDFEAGPLVTIDSLIIEGNPRETPSFIQAMSRIHPGDPFDQHLIDRLPNTLNNSIYYQQAKVKEVEFSRDHKATVSLSLERRQAGKFDLLLGILPPNVPGPDQRVQITGQADILLVSALRLGEIIRFQYNQLNATTRILDAGYTQPYLLGTPFEVSGSFFFQVQDSAFLNRSLQLEVVYPISSQLRAAVNFRSRSSDLLDARPYAQDTLPPPILNGQQNTYGVSLAYESLDYRLNPRRGVDAAFSLALGQRSIEADGRLQPEVFAQLPARQSVIELEGHFNFYFPTFKRQVIRLANQSYWLRQDRIFQNDQRQIGGGKSIRGFNENEFFADLISFFTLEYRLLLDRNSHIFAFGDWAFLRNRLNVAEPNQTPLGLGIGLRFDTGAAGILSVIYGMGTVGERALQPSRGKIHIGLTSQF